MISGVYRNPTTIFFGKDAEQQLGNEIKKYSRNILMVYGGSSIKKHGTYNKIIEILHRSEISVTELEGVKPNPESDLVYKGIELCRGKEIDFILAVGGGSVIDTAKAIGVGVPYDGDFFDLFEKKSVPKQMLKVGTVLTISGAGSESSDGAVITHSQTKQKYDCGSPDMYPTFSFINPELALTVPKHLTHCGIVDAITHVMERYFSNTTYVDTSDRLSEGLIKTLMKYGRLISDDLQNIDYRAEIMWASKLAHDNTCGFGRKHDWGTHKICHEIAARYDVTHGAILGVVFPSWMKYVYKTNKRIFLQFAERIFDIDTTMQSEDETIMLAIKSYQEFLKSLNMPITLKDMGLSIESEYEDIALKTTQVYPSGTIGNFQRLNQKDIVEVLKLST